MNKKRILSKTLVGIMILTTSLQSISPISSMASDVQTKTVTFLESSNSDQSKSLNLLKLDQIVGIETDHGSVDYSRNGDEVKIYVSSDVPSRKEWNPTKYSKGVTSNSTSSANSFENTKSYLDGEGYSGTLSKDGVSYVISGTYTPSDSKTVTTSQSNYTNSFASTISYSSGGYSGTLSKSGSSTATVESGTYTPSDTIWVTNQTSQYYNSGGYSGTLTQYVVSGSYTPSDTKTVNDFRTSSTNSFPSSVSYNSDGYSGTLTKNGYSYVISGSPADSKFVSGIGSTSQGKMEVYQYSSSTKEWSYHHSYTVSPWITQDYNYNSGGYSGTLQPNFTSRSAITYYSLPSYPYDGQQVDHKRYTNYYNYEGTVYKPDTRVWEQKYSGSVTKPAVDTRVYRYQGYVTKPASDTRVWKYTQSYSGTVTKPASDTRIWQQDYKGTAYKGDYDNYYAYNVTISYTTDTTPPDLATFSANITSPTNQDVLLTVKYPVDSVIKQVRLNGGEWVEYNGEILFSENGVIEARSFDKLNNLSEVSRYDVQNIDRIAPNEPNFSIVNNQNKIKVSSNDDSKLYYRLNDGSWNEYQGEVMVEDGDYKIDFKSIDSASNESKVVSVNGVMYANALKEAVSKVEIAENTPLQSNVDSAKVSVDKLPHDVPEYLPLLNRIKDIQALVDAQTAIDKAIETRSEQDVALAKEKIELLNNSNPVILDLMDEIQENFNEADILALVAKERYDILSSKYQMSKEAYVGLVNIYYAIKYTGDFMYQYAEEKVALIPNTDKYFTFVQNQLDNLKADYKQFVEERTQTDAYNKAESSVAVMESKYDPTLAVNTQNLINAVEDTLQRNELQKRLDTAKAKYEASLLDKASQNAILAVEKAESTKQTYYVSEAYKKVNALLNELLKTELTNRLQVLEAQMKYDRQLADAKRTVELAEQYKYESYITSAQNKVTALPDGADKTALQERLNVLKAGLPTSDQATIIKQATNYVSLAQSIKTQYYVDKAQGYINQILDVVKKAELQAKLDAVVVVK